MAESKGEITGLLARWRDGDENALAELTPLIYRELHRLAHRYLQSERTGHTLQSTELVHEAYLRLVDSEPQPWQSRTHFFAVAASIIRHILVDYARARLTAKRGEGACLLSLDEAILSSEPRGVDLIALDDALLSLSMLDPRQSRVVELRFFGGLSIEETAEVLGISSATVKREWVLAKSWIFLQISGDSLDADGLNSTEHDR